MKRIISLLLALTLLVGCVTVLSSCGEKDNGAEIAVYLGSEVYDLDPSDYYVSDNAAQFMSLLFEPLFSLNEKGKLQMAAAEDYEIIEEDREIRITLRESYWSDGNRVVPNDFIFAWERLLNPANANPAAALLYDIEGALEVKTGKYSSLYDASANNYGDGETIVINYRENADVDALLKNLASIATAPVRQSVVESSVAFWAKSASSIATNGAFTVASINVEPNVDGEEFEDLAICLERNTGYHQPRDSKRADKFVKPYQIVSFWDAAGKTIDLTYSDIQSKTVFFLGDATEEARKNAILRDEAEAYKTLSTFTLAFLSDNDIFANADVRKAMSLALNRKAVADALVFADAASGFLPETVKLDAADIIKAGADVAGAQAKLPAEAKAIQIKVALTDDTKGHIIGAMLEEAWKTGLGLNVKIDYLGAKELKITDPTLGEVSYYDSYVQYLVKSAAQGSAAEYDVVGFDWQMYSQDAFVGLAALSTAFCGNGVVFSDNAANADTLRPSLAVWGDKAGEYDALIKAAYEATDAKEREAKLKQAADMVATELPVIPVVFNYNFGVIGSELSGVDVDYFGNFAFDGAKLKNYQDYYVFEKESAEK